MRRFSKFATASVKPLLNRLVSDVDAMSYRDTMTRIGGVLGTLAAHQLGPVGRCLLICTNEDADFLARGLLDALTRRGLEDIALACFWNERVRESETGIDVAPILRSYIEPTDLVNTFIVVKSIISSACVVRTNITELVYKQKPQRILVVAPVLLEGARQRLKAEFPPDISRRFRYLWLAEDDEAESDGTVLPGIGGSVYARLGIVTEGTKNTYVPELVRERRRRFHTTAAAH